MSATQPWPEQYRPPEAERRHLDRTEPVRIEARTRWLYSDSLAAFPAPGAHWHAFACGADVTRSDVKPIVGNSIRDHLHAAVDAFGDDVDLVIEVRRREPT